MERKTTISPPIQPQRFGEEKTKGRREGLCSIAAACGELSRRKWDFAPLFSSLPLSSYSTVALPSSLMMGQCVSDLMPCHAMLPFRLRFPLFMCQKQADMPCLYIQTNILNIRVAELGWSRAEGSLGYWGFTVPGCRLQTRQKHSFPVRTYQVSVKPALSGPARQTRPVKQRRGGRSHTTVNYQQR